LVTKYLILRKERIKAGLINPGIGLTADFTSYISIGMLVLEDFPYSSLFFILLIEIEVLFSKY